MIKDNVTKFPLKVDQQNNKVTLEKLEDMMSAWRSNKKNTQEQITQEIWDVVFILIKTIPQSKICTASGITARQLKRKIQSIQNANTIKDNHINNQSSDKLEFCKITPEKPSIPIAYKPAKAFATNTSIVELYRADGMLMKIHICTDSFNDLLEAFFKGSL